MQRTTGWYFIHIHLPSGIKSVKRSITRQAGQPLPKATSSIMTHKRRPAAMTLMEASILSGWAQSFPPLWTNEQTEVVTPILKVRRTELRKLNF